MKRIFLLAGICFIGNCVTAQSPYSSKYNQFTADEIRGCVPFKITLNTNGLCTPCNINYDGTTTTNSTTFTYNTPGTYKLIVVFPSNGVSVDSITVHAYPDVQPPFDIYSCNGSKVEVNITDKTYDTYYIDFDFNTGVDKTLNKGLNQTATYSYATVTAKQISVKGQRINSKNNCSPKILPFTPVATLPLPTITSLIAVDASTIQLNYTPTTNVEYKNEIGFNSATSFQTLQTLYGVNTVTVPNLNINNNFYCFRLSSFDPCANTNNYTAPICSHKFSVLAANRVNQLSWVTSNLGVSSIKVKRDNTTLATLAGTSTSYNDNAVTCKTKYGYQLVSTYAGGATSTSLIDSVTAISTVPPTAVNNTSTVVGEPQVDLLWLQDPAFTPVSYDVLRGPKGVNSFLPIGNSTSPDFTDESYNNQSVCYQINYTDNCGTRSANGLPVCPILLSGSADVSNDVTTNWTGYKGWNMGVKNYKLIKYYQPGQTPISVYTGPDSTFFDNQLDPSHQVVYYRVTGVANEAGVSPSLSNVIKVVRNINLYYPTAFNPESKVASVNKTFTVKGHFIASMKLQVFDRWGSLVFYSDKDEPWDGKKDGQAMPDASYVWTADGTDLSGASFKRAGTIVLIRK